MKQTTRWVTFGGLLAIALFDVWAIAASGVDASVSQFITDCSASPRIAFVCGCLVTHWFGWVMIPARYMNVVRHDGRTSNVAFNREGRG